MPQEQHVVRCYKCQKFQVQIVKKAPKWQCKVCNEKQSIMKVFAQGSGKECREHVQNLNMQQGLLMSQQTPDYESPSHFEDQPFASTVTADQFVNQNSSKWSEYLDDTGPCEDGLQNQLETSDDLPKINNRGRKRRLSNQDDYEDFCNYQESSQPEEEILDLSSGPCASDILKSLHGKPENSRLPMSPQSASCSFSSSSKSKWSQFVAPKEDDHLAPGNENPETPWNRSSNKFMANAATHRPLPLVSNNSHSHILPRGSNYTKQEVMENEPNECISYVLPSKGKGNLTSSKTAINPFCTTAEDENLDTLLDF